MKKGCDNLKIKLVNIEKKFKDNLIFSNVNLEFNSGKIYGLIGRNGSGKSVLLKMLCGFYVPSEGEIYLDDYNFIKNNEFPRDIGALIEKPSFLPNLTGYENLKYLSNIQKKIDDNQIYSTLKIVNLLDDKDKLYFKYSLGMKQKLGIAQAIMEDPEIIILDEPFNGIELTTAKKIRKYLSSIKKNKIIIIATHIKDDLIDFVDEIYEFNDKKVRKYK